MIDSYISPGELRAIAGQTEPPFDMVEIVTAMGAKVYLTKYEPDDGEDVAASVVIVDAEPVIYVAKSLTHRDRRLMIAHEIGHLAMGHMDGRDGELIDTAKRMKMAFWNFKERDAAEEREANAYAAELLMPERWVKQALVAGIRTIEELTILFSVPERAMRARLAAMKEGRPCCMM